MLSGNQCAEDYIGIIAKDGEYIFYCMYLQD